ncbi:synapse-associated protein 1-like [Cebidichthys violaceus]|uniref:synapse-associated protein 1-like n=1 Tax=Cebidichthys violaceus TaxID=271503 RepID=UPI0035CA44DB
MFKNWGTWLGVENKNVQEDETAADVDEEEEEDVNKREEDVQQQLLHKATSFSGYVYNFASSASKKLSESVVETAQTLKKSVGEGRINDIIDKTILGEFQKEQEKFVQEKKAKTSGAAVAPWVGSAEEDVIQQQILALSADKRNFLRDPPAGVPFHFDAEQMYPSAALMLEEDELLRKMRFHLVPKQVKEEVFWRNYFYRVSLIKQSARLTALAAQQAAERRREETTSETVQRQDVVKEKSPPVVCSAKPKSSEDEEEIPSGSELVSDAFDSKINEDDLRKEMEQLKETPDWERELQEELQDYDVLADNENRDDRWDKEIEEMLMEDS